MHHFTENEKYSANMIIFIASLEGVILTIANIFSKDEYKTYISIGLLVTTIVILMSFKEKIFLYLIKNLSPSKSKRQMHAGKWLLDISFADDTKGRFGTCNIVHSILGVKIHGDKLMNKKSKKITSKDFWISDSAEIIQQGDDEVLIYLYKIPSDSTQKNKYEEMHFDKVGIVVAHKVEIDNEITYVGSFRDIPLDEDQKDREGKITLSPTPTN